MENIIISLPSTAPQEQRHRIAKALNRAIAWFLNQEEVRKEDKEHALTLLELMEGLPSSVEK